MRRVQFIDMFCGCGGVSSGFMNARAEGACFELIGAVDNDAHACATFERNLGVRPLIEDVRKLEGDLEAWDGFVESIPRDPASPLVLVGCAPCQGFSSHRKRHAADDERNSLIEVFAQLALRLQPDAIFVENVPDMFADRHWPFFERARASLQAAGYTVKGKIYNLAEFGLPQERFRAVVLAFRRDFTMPRPQLTPSEFRTVRQAIGHLPEVASGEICADDPMHMPSRHGARVLDIIRQVPKDGGNRPKGVGPACLDRTRRKHGGYTDVYGRLWWDRPALTITARCRTPSCGRFLHPAQDRGLTIREAALLQGFPADYYFEGPFDDKFKQVGNAVPPTFAEQVGEHVLRTLSAPTVRQKPLGSRGSDGISGPIGPSFSILINGLKRRRHA